MGPVRQNPIKRTVSSVHMCVQFIVALILHRTDLIIFPLALQTITTAPMMSIWGKVGRHGRETIKAKLHYAIQLANQFTSWSATC